MKVTLSRRQRSLPYSAVLTQANALSWKHLSDIQLKSAISGCDAFDLPSLLSLLKDVISRHTGLTLYDTQLSAACAMLHGGIAELPTGEGKTLAAVVVAACLGLQGRHVHVLTFNDYLAKRDCQLAADILHDCGLNCSYIREDSTLYQRQEAYRSDVVYASAKQVGYDYLKNFLCCHQQEWLPIRFDAAIVDEADSLMIDEARIPLVVAGTDEFRSADALRIDRMIGKLDASDIVCDAAEHIFWFTEQGISRLERELQIDNLYSDANSDLLTLIDAAVKARYFLVKDRDYLVREQRIQVIDRLTGRIALSRKFPAALQRAVEIREGLPASGQTTVYNSIPMQFFLLKYPLLCGMTGTAASAASELKDMYGLEVEVIPPHVPCIRRDHPDCLCDTEDEKRQKILQQVKLCYDKGQPVLIGTQSVGESEQYSALLTASGLPHMVLNARNDDQEADIIADAGRPFAITISTNMAGRGVDIRLGGQMSPSPCSQSPLQNTLARTTAEQAGGLFIVGCGLNESPRIDRQLIGRSGRQGDPGESQFFISLQDPLLRLLRQCEFSRPVHRLGQVERMETTARQIRRIQRSLEGKSAEIRYMLSKYAAITELHRQQITYYRDDILLGIRQSNWLQHDDPDFFHLLCDSVGTEGVSLAERQLILYFVNQHWADYLATMENVRNGIHLTVIGGLNPIDEYQKTATCAFSSMEDDIRRDVLQYMRTCAITDSGIDLADAGLQGATSTCTYMINENRNQFVRLPKFFHHRSDPLH